MLSVNHLSKSFDGIQALYDFSLNVQRGDIVGLFGPNGRWKDYLSKRGDGICAGGRRNCHGG